MIEGTFLIDAHVHFYRHFDETLFFDSAAANMDKAAQTLGLGDAWIGCLLFAESRNDDFFSAFRAAGRAGERWQLTPTAEPNALLAGRSDRPELILVAGRQIETAEKLEVLALGSSRTVADHQPLEATIDQVRADGAIVVLPWGFGKWTFARGRRIAEFLQSTDAADVHLGDNSGRLQLSPWPQLFGLGQRRGLLVLPGSDPLPLPAAATKVASYGFVLEGRVDPRTPATDLKRLITTQTTQPVTFGRRERLLPFCRNQVLMQLRKRRLGR